MVYLAWRYGGADPFQTYNGLDRDYRPIEGGEPVRPPYPARLRWFIYAMGQAAFEEEAEIHGVKLQQRRRR